MSSISNGVFVEHGGADTNEFWDVSFTREQIAYAGLETERNGVSVVIDQEAGTVSLNAGYIENSPEGRDERTLWAEYEDLIVEALYNRIEFGHGNDAFLREAEGDLALRTGRIADILETVEDHEEEEA